MITKNIEKISFRRIWMIIILSPLIVAVLVSINIVDIPTDNDWIGFYAAITGGLLGGLLTFYSMYLSMSGINEQIAEQRQANKLAKDQLNNNNKKYIEEQRLSVRPYINESKTADANILTYRAHIFEVSPEEYSYEDHIQIKLKNIGIGPLISFKVVAIKEYGKDELYSPMHADFKSIATGDIMDVQISFMTKSDYLMTTLEIIIEYFDILDNKYVQSIKVLSYRDNEGKYKKCNVDSISKQDFHAKV